MRVPYDPAAYWAHAEQCHKEIATWPEWKRRAASFTTTPTEPFESPVRKIRPVWPNLCTARVWSNGDMEDCGHAVVKEGRCAKHAPVTKPKRKTTKVTDKMLQELLVFTKLLAVGPKTLPRVKTYARALSTLVRKEIQQRQDIAHRVEMMLSPDNRNEHIGNDPYCQP